VIARMLRKARAAQLAACARHGKLGALRDGLSFIAREPPFGARLLPDAVTDWLSLLSSWVSRCFEPSMREFEL